MAVTVSRWRYPILKVMLLLAGLAAVVGLVLFFAQGNQDPAILLYTWVPAIALALLGAAVRRRENVEVLMPSDQLQDASRSEVEGIIAKLDEARAKGEISEERYRKAKARVTKAANTGKGGKRDGK
jgi:hypothetical protein